VLEIVDVDLIFDDNNNSVFTKLNIQDITLEVELPEWPVLDVIPENQPIRWITCIVPGANKANNVGSEEHLSDLDSSFEVPEECALEFMSVEYSDSH